MSGPLAVRSEVASTLCDAFGLRDHRVVAFTGGGGKTTAMFRVASELSADRVLVTTTTKIWVPHPEQAELIVVDDLAAACEQLAAGWERGIRALGTDVTPDAKLRGIPPEWAATLAQVADRVLVEADGAAGKPLTAPRDYEPVIPTSAELVVPVCGLDAVGASLDEEHVHRAAEISALLFKKEGLALSPRDVAAIMLSPWGNIKGAPVGARFVPLVNKADGLAAFARERKAASDPLKLESFETYLRALGLTESLLSLGAARVVVASLAANPPEIWVARPGPDFVPWAKPVGTV